MPYTGNDVKREIVKYASKQSYFGHRIGHFILPAQFSGMAGKASIFLFSGVWYTSFRTREKGAKIRVGGE